MFNLKQGSAGNMIISALSEDPVKIKTWFKLVADSVIQYGIVDSDIYNFDETGFQLGAISTAMIVTGAHGSKRPNSIQPGNREWATVIEGICAQGWAIPPFIILTGRVHQSTWYAGVTIPSGWAISVSTNGWTTNEHELEWIKHFDAHTKQRSTGRKRLLIIDGHKSHQSAEFQHYCEEHNIITLCMPAHSSHILQPRDVA
jgi:hypothetical protein